MNRNRTLLVLVLALAAINAGIVHMIVVALS